MKFKVVLNEVFSSKAVDSYDYYANNQKKKKARPDRWEPIIVKNELNDFGPMGTLKKKKKPQ